MKNKPASPVPAAVAADYVQALVGSSPQTIGQKIQAARLQQQTQINQSTGFVDSDAHLRTAGAQPGQRAPANPARRPVQSAGGKTA